MTADRQQPLQPLCRSWSANTHPATMITYDVVTHAQYQYLVTPPIQVAHSVQQPDGRIFDYDASGQLVGIETLFSSN